MANPLDGSIPIEDDDLDPHGAEATEARLRTDAAMDVVLPEEFAVMDAMGQAAALEVTANTPEPAVVPQEFPTVADPAAPLTIDFPDVRLTPAVGMEAAIKQASPVTPKRTFTPRRRTASPIPPPLRAQARAEARVLNDMAVDAAEERLERAAGENQAAPQAVAQTPPPNGETEPQQLVARAGQVAQANTEAFEAMLRLMTKMSDQLISVTRRVEQIESYFERSNC